jgi:glycosyltransferase involved in cell wall biosynthesis
MSVHLVDWSRVDRLIFVAPHLRRLARAAVPVLRGVPTSVLPNATLLADIPRTKVPEAARTLALIGWGQAVKDPLYALEILGRLRLSDDSWRLLLVGNPFPEHDRTRSEAYRDRVQERLARADLAGAVDLVAWTPDLTELFSRVGFILSTSLRESFHISLIQAAASGAVPVVRDWPVVAAYGGPSSFLPKDWVIRTPAEAAARILDYADPARRSEAGEVASHWVRKRYDWGRVARSYDDVLLGR